MASRWAERATIDYKLSSDPHKVPGYCEQFSRDQIGKNKI